MTDRDADNVPSDRVRAYTEAMRYTRWMSGDSRVGAVMAFADREQAELRAEIELAWQSSTHWKDRAEKAEATIARVEAIVADPVFLQSLPRIQRARLLAALRGPEPTEETK